MRHIRLSLVVLILAARTVQAGPFDRDTTLFGPVTEWSLENSSFAGNPFDLEATVTFRHDGSGEIRTTHMYYDSANTWKFRFTGTRTGTWQFSSSSADGELSGLNGTVTVAAGSDPSPRGFLVAADSMFARQVGETGLLGEAMHVYMNVVSNDLRPDGSPADEFYQLAVAQLNNSRHRPVIFERRFGYMRDGIWTAENTRRAMWQFTMAGGAAGWFGFRAGSSITAPGPYPNSAQLQTHDTFWKNRLLTNMKQHNELVPDSLAWALATPDLDNIIIYAQDTDHITLDLSGIDGALAAVAVDAKGAYLEIPLGQLNANTNQWVAPYASDWALAISLPVPEPTSGVLLFIGTAMVLPSKNSVGRGSRRLG